MKLLKAEYNRRAQLRPLLWDNTLQLPLENVYTRLKIFSRRKAGVQAKGNEMNVCDIFGASEKGEDAMTLVDLPRPKVGVQAEVDEVNVSDIFGALEKDEDVMMPVELPRRKAGVQAEGNEVNLSDIFGASEKGEDAMTLVDLRGPNVGVQAEGDEVNVSDIFGAHEKGEDVMTLVEGSPGIGKTTFCLKLAYDWANENAATTLTFPKFELVLLLKCRDIETDIMDAIVEQLLPQDVEDKTREKVLDFIRDIHNQERILIILDGLDELPQKSKHHVDKLLDRRILPFCYVVATTRQEKGIEVRKNFVFDILLQIEGFTENDSFEYIKKHFASVGPRHSSKGEMLIEEIKENTLLHALRNNPLNLLLLCVIYEDYEGKLPSSRSAL